MSRTSKRARRTSPLNLPGAFELFTPSKELVLKNIWVFGTLYGITMFLNLVSWILTPASNKQTWFDKMPSGSDFSGVPSASFFDLGFMGITLAWVLVLVLVSLVIQMMNQKAQLVASNDKQVDFQHLWTTVKKYGLRLVGLYVVVGIITVIGFILLIIPGFIMMRRYFVSAYVMLDKNLGIFESMEASAKMTKPYSGSVYSIILVMLLFALISVIPFFGWLVSFVLGMLYSVAPALRYQQLKQLDSQ